jgi:hypothetical protein
MGHDKDGCSPLQARRIAVEQVLITRVRARVCILPECGIPRGTMNMLDGNLETVELRGIPPSSRKSSNARSEMGDP